MGGVGFAVAAACAGSVSGGGDGVCAALDVELLRWSDDEVGELGLEFGAVLGALVAHVVVVDAEFFRCGGSGGVASSGS